jgi:hypothetical protein
LFSAQTNLNTWKPTQATTATCFLPVSCRHRERENEEHLWNQHNPLPCPSPLFPIPELMKPLTRNSKLAGFTLPSQSHHLCTFFLHNWKFERIFWWQIFTKLQHHIFIKQI